MRGIVAVAGYSYVLIGAQFADQEADRALVAERRGWPS
jgi:hypothetical protein